MSEDKKDKKDKKEKVKGGNKKVLIFIIIGVLILGGGGFAGYYFLIAKKAATATNGIAVVGQVQTGTQTAVQSAVIPKLSVDFDQFITNLADESGKKYIQIKVSVGYDNSKLTKEFDTKKPMIRDAIVSVLRTKKSTDLTSKGIDDMKLEMLNKINPLLENGRAINVYFSDIVIQ